MGGCISFFKNLIRKNKEVVEDIIETIDEYDDIVYDTIEQILEDEIKKRTNMDIDIGGYIDQVDKGITDFAKGLVNDTDDKVEEEIKKKQ
jgi:hypothetical protein